MEEKEQNTLASQPQETKPQVPEPSPPPPRRKKRKKWPFVLLAVLAVILAGAFLTLRNRDQSDVGAVGAYITALPERRTIQKSLTGKGTLKPADSYTVTTLIEGEILTADFSEGDWVEKNTVLYELDDSAAVNTIEQAQRSLEQAQLNLEQSRRSLQQAQRSYSDSSDNRNVRTGVSGTVTALHVKPGDKVSPGQSLASVRDSSVMSVKVPFPSDDVMGFYVGQSAVVTLDGSFETLYGTVSEISAADTAGTGNMLTRNVTVQVENPGALTDGQAASVSIEDINGAGSATFTYRAEQTVTAEAAGTVSEILAPEGTWVENGAVLMTLGGTVENGIRTAAETVENSTGGVRNAELSVENARLNLENARDRLDSYIIRSPISGTIVQKDYKAGDRISAGKAMCIIYDLDYLTLTMNVDELDISDISVGQSVTVTADALPGRTYAGTVTRLSVAGTTVNGATSYPVTVRLDETEGLLPGMNVDAEINVAMSENTLSVPNEAVSRGNVVLITAASPSAVRQTGREAPEGYVYVPVTPGISDDRYTEILDGLTEEDTVAYQPADTASNPVDLIMEPEEEDW